MRTYQIFHDPMRRTIYGHVTQNIFVKIDENGEERPVTSLQEEWREMVDNGNWYPISQVENSFETAVARLLGRLES